MSNLYLDEVISLSLVDLPAVEEFAVTKRDSDDDEEPRYNRTFVADAKPGGRTLKTRREWSEQQRERVRKEYQERTGISDEMLEKLSGHPVTKTFEQLKPERTPRAEKSFSENFVADIDQ